MSFDYNKWNDYFSKYSYVGKYTFTEKDSELYSQIRPSVKEEINKFIYLNRWYNHISSFKNLSKDVYSPKSIENLNMSNENEDLPQLLLNHLSINNSFDSLLFASSKGLDHQKVIGAVKSLLSNDEVISTKDETVTQYELTEEGKAIVAEGSHEYRVWQAIGESGISQSEIMKFPFGKLGQAKAMQNKWIAIDKSGGEVRLVRKVNDITEDTVKVQLETCINDPSKLSESIIKELKKRKLLVEVTTKKVIVFKGRSFTTHLVKHEADLTPELIQSGEWATKQFKKYNFDALGVLPKMGHLHPLLKVRSELRSIFLQMGFEEMDTSRWVESSFWNFDALFQPQQHPARDQHDTFFVGLPERSTKFPLEYLEKVKKVHSEGGYGSFGYKYNWKLDEAEKNLMRTHTTAVSARNLYKLAQNGFKPAKFFSIDRVFRNETLDATHLAEFYQVEGVVAEEDLSLASLMGVISTFFKNIGMENLKFKPAYNPYTEPSMEIFAYHGGLKKWVEIGNSGMFRPEMLRPMGLPENVNVAGFGLSLERPTMIKYGLSNIRDLFGPKVDLQMIYKNPICRFDKEYNFEMTEKKDVKSVA
uniref:phenylalanine--tRNA ligase n=1 Tax=Strongyloides venezuelensis TaxID=75913 RepID=A0A0K0FVC2_STRVS